jgi:hypothetical protein
MKGGFTGDPSRRCPLRLEPISNSPTRTYRRRRADFLPAFFAAFFLLDFFFAAL